MILNYILWYHLTNLMSILGKVIVLSTSPYHPSWIDNIPQYVLDINLHSGTLMSNTNNESNENDQIICEE